MLRLLPLEKASGICAKIACLIGPWTSVTKIARSNLKLAYGQMDQDTEDKIIQELWDNFGRFIGEFPHIHMLSDKEIMERVEIIGMENVLELQNNHRPFLLCTGHFANWEFILRILSKLYPEFGIIYRKANNPFIDKIINKGRDCSYVNLVEKGPYGVRSLVKSIQSNHSIAMLVDQKMNDGISVQFFGKPAMTAPAIAKFAQQFNYPIIPMQIIREKNSRFKVILHPQLDIDNQSIISVMQNINNILETWIRQYPGQWFWFHNRWGKK